MAVCKKCKGQLPEGAVVCSVCGTSVEAVVCRKCGNVLKTGSGFCDVCGKKAPVEGKRKFPVLIVAVVAAALAVGCGFGLFFGMRAQPAAEQTMQLPLTTVRPSATEPVGTTLIPDPTEAPQPESTQPTGADCWHDYVLVDFQEADCTAQGFERYICALCGAEDRKSVPALGHEYAPATCQTPQVCIFCGATQGDTLTHSYAQGYCIHCGLADFTDPRVVFAYRPVWEDDYISDHYVNLGTDIIITGVKEISPDGVYEVPDFIDGQRVVGIDPWAFNDSDARQITLGQYVRKVAGYSMICENLEALYVRSDWIHLGRSALIEPGFRTSQLTIYCSEDCVWKDDLGGEYLLRDKVKVFRAEYREWDG